MISVYGTSLIHTAFEIYKLLELTFRKFWIENFAQSQISQNSICWTVITENYILSGFQQVFCMKP